MAEIRMPKMGDGMEEGTINVWLVKEGQQVTAGDTIAEVETDKANVEIAAYETGVLSKIIVQVGQTVPVGEVIAVIGTPAAVTVPLQATNGSNGASAPSSHPLEKAPMSAGGEEGTPAPVTSVKGEPTGEVPADAIARGFEGERVKASPLARSKAKEAGIDLARVHGTGPNGRIVERDIQAYLTTRGTDAETLLRPATAPETIKPVASRPAVEVAASPNAPLAGEDIIPSRMRKAIASVTVKSKQTAPHFYVTMIVEMDRAQALLRELNADGAAKITVNDLVVKASAVALGRVPEVNATWTADGTIHRYAEAHIGVAVGIEEGLVIPVVRDCHTKTLRQISADAKALIGKARAGQLKPEEYSGGTFSVSNLGMMGVDEFIAIINPPEAAILAIGGIVREPVVGANDELKIRARMKVTISADHRLLDGVVAARFLQEVKKAIESPFSLLS